MSGSFSLASSGAVEIQRRIGDLVDAFGDLTPLMEGFGSTLEGFVLEAFETETAPDGTRWEPSLRKKTEGGKTLTKSGQLRDSRTHVAGSDFVEVGSNKIYAGVHNDGATIRAKTAAGLRFELPGGLGFRRVMEVELPRRQFLGISDEAEIELLAQTDDYVRDAMGPPA